MSIYRNHTQSPGNLPDASAIPQHYHISACTHEGKVRTVNEDNFTVNGIIGLEEGQRRSLRGRGMRAPLVCAVFDGTGGAAAGVGAARLAAEYATWLYSSYVKSPSDRERLINRYVGECNAGILSRYYSCQGSRGATTFAMAMLNGGRLHVYSLGDSRLYLCTGGRLYLVTNDHTVAMERFRSGVYTREQAQHSADRHKLTGFFGMEPADAARAEKYDTIHTVTGDSLLLCTDGLYSMLSDSEIADVLLSGSADKARELIDLAVMRGGRDNVTCVVIDCAE